MTRRPASFDAELLAALPRLKHFALKLTRDATRTEDLVQTALVHALEHAHRYKPGTNMAAWLCVILRNRFYDEARRVVRMVPTDPSVLQQDSALVQLPSQGTPTSRDIADGLACVAPMHREVVLLFGWDGLAYDEIAARIGVPIGTVRSRISRGRQVLAAAMGGAP